MNQIEIQINELPENFVFGEKYTFILYFQDKNKEFLRNEKLPQGHRQNLVIDKLPFSLSFNIGEGVFLTDVYTLLLIEKNGVMLYGEQFGNIDVQNLEITGVSVECK